MRRPFLAGVAVVLGLGATACLDALEPDVGAPLRETCVNEDSDPGTDVSYSVDIVSGIFLDEDIACADCHAPNADTPIGFEVSGLDVSTYNTLRAGGALSGADIVIANGPCDSILVQKVGGGPPFGARMPLNGPALTDAERQLIHDWIAEGARDN